jgi:hypothetical protein
VAADRESVLVELDHGVQGRVVAFQTQTPLVSRSTVAIYTGGAS